MLTVSKALLIIDMLNDFARQGAPLYVPKTKDVIPFIKAEIEKARAEGIPVIYICDSHQPDDIEFSRFGWPPHAIAGSEGARVIQELIPSSQDYIVYKTTYSGFYRTELDDLLKKLGVKKVIITGCVTHICILFTASDAVLRGYEVEIPENCVAGLEEEDHRAALRIMKNVLGVIVK